MFAHRDIKAAFAGKESGLLLHRGVIRVNFRLTGADTAAAGHGAEGEAATGTDAGLFAVVVVAVLLTLQG
ncbi:Uncharacterised protein [Yersinia aldovae]|uniref:Uncharacterized protein n=1 Tax=Yersinia aldovae TaxID=29483 RepID=A0ABM9SVT8_YERAL|nr:Uncharacterised protein [Yersinia aldovae]